MSLSVTPIAAEIRNVMIEMGLDKVSGQITGLTNLMGELQTKQNNLQESLQFTQADHDKTKTAVAQLTDENILLKKKLNFVESKITEIEKNQIILKDGVIDSQYRSMRNNLLFHGIPEIKGEKNSEVLTSFMITYLKIDSAHFHSDHPEHIYISRSHRFGAPGSSGTRPIIAVFVEGTDLVLRRAKNLAGTKYFVANQVPQEIAERKRLLQPLYKNAKSQGRRVKYIGRGEALSIDNMKIETPDIPPSHLSINEIIATTPKVPIWGTQAITDQGNHFLAHIAKVKSPAEIATALSIIKHTENRGTSRATHNIVAARIQAPPSPGQSQVMEFCQDDGEHGGARNILKELQINNITNAMVVVSRWYSGIKLGNRRFAIITQCTKAAIGMLVKPPRTPNPHAPKTPRRQRQDQKSPPTQAQHMMVTSTPTTSEIQASQQNRNATQAQHTMVTSPSTTSEIQPSQQHHYPSTQMNFKFAPPISLYTQPDSSPLSTQPVSPTMNSHTISVY